MKHMDRVERLKEMLLNRSRTVAAVKTHISEAASKRTHGVWLPPGTWSREAEEEARRHNLPVVRDSCIMEDHRHLCDTQGNPRAGHPRLVCVL